jgi:hypothetical protein
VPRRGLYGIGLAFAAVGFGLTVAHFLEIPGKRQLTAAEWLDVQHSFYGGFAIFGAIAEVGGLLVSLALVARGRRQGCSSPWPIIAALAFAGMLVDYWFGNRPLNDQIASWTSATIPADWTNVRDRWDTVHTISTVFAAVAFGSLLAGLLTAPRN